MIELQAVCKTFLPRASSLLEQDRRRNRRARTNDLVGVIPV
jgi:hypothetical protein